jgi:hypothetical protein
LKAIALVSLREPGRSMLAFVVLLGLVSTVHAQDKTAELLFPMKCEQVIPIVVPMFEERGLKLHPVSKCATCFEGSTMELYDASGKTVRATAAYKRYVDHQDLPHSNIFRWYTEREFHALAHLVIEQHENACRVSLGFGFSFYGIELLAGLPVDGDRIAGKSNLRLEKEHLDHLRELVSQANH